MAINFISSTYSDEICIMHVHNIEIMIRNETDEINEVLFKTLLRKYQEGLEKKMRGSKFVFDSVDLLHYNLHKISLNQGGSNKDSPI